jgi:hypothetical protein
VAGNLSIILRSTTRRDELDQRLGRAVNSQSLAARIGFDI